MNYIDTRGILEFTQIIVELLDFELHLKSDDLFYRKNIIGINKKSGKKIWVVDYPEDNVFIAIRKNDDYSLLGITHDGTNYDINLETGKATKIGWGK